MFDAFFALICYFFLIYFFLRIRIRFFILFYRLKMLYFHLNFATKIGAQKIQSPKQYTTSTNTQTHTCTYTFVHTSFIGFYSILEILFAFSKMRMWYYKMGIKRTLLKFIHLIPHWYECNSNRMDSHILLLEYIFLLSM